MAQWKQRFLTGACCALAAVAGAEEGKLGEARKEVRTPSSSGSSSDASGGSGHAAAAAAEEIGDDADVAGILLLIITSPITLPHAALDDDFSVPGFFPRAPYLYRHHGYLVTDRIDEGGIPGSIHWRSIAMEQPGYHDVREWGAQLAVEGGYDFDGVARGTGRMLFDTTWRIGFEGSFSFLRERLDGGGEDRALLGDAEVFWRFAQCAQATMRIGVGARVLRDNRQTDSGVNFIYAADVFPVQPLVVSAEIELGTLGHASTFEARVSAGAVWHGIEIYAGYDYLKVGEVALHGPLAGLRGWF